VKGGHASLSDEASAPPIDAAGAARFGAEDGAVGTRGLAAIAAWSQHALALADQAVVSGASFLTTILVSRWTQAGQLGLYVIAISVIVTVLGVQESLIALPYTIQRQNAPGAQAERAGRALIQSALFSVASFLLLAAAAVALWARGANSEAIVLAWATAAMAPFSLLREFARRFAFAHLDSAMALALDLAVTAIQIAALFGLGWTGNMSAATACLALGGACAVTALAWFSLAHAAFVFRPGALRGDVQQSWALGGWLLAGQITVSVQGYVAYWLLAALLGAATTGVFAACVSVVSFANPLIGGLRNILMPRAVEALRQGGLAPLRRQVAADTLLLGLTMIVFCIVVALAGADVMRLLFPGKAYEGQALTVTILAVASLANAVGVPASNALAAMQRPQAIVWAGLLAVGLTGGLLWALVEPLGLLGAALAFLAGSVAASAGRWVAFLALVGAPEVAKHRRAQAEDGGAAKARSVLRQLTGGVGGEEWIIERLSDGAQATAYVVRSRDERPVWRSHAALVIKIFEPPAFSSPEFARRQFNALAQLHAALHECAVADWRISVPAPIYLCESPLALVMTLVGGRKLDACLESGWEMTPEATESAVHALVAAMQRCWPINSQPHGDLDLNNILWDTKNRSLSLVDPGASDSCSCLGASLNTLLQASRNLGYMLYATATALKHDIGRFGAASRKRGFVVLVLRGFLDALDPPDAKRRAFDEIELCAKVYLGDMELSWWPRGLWRTLVKINASHQIESLMRGVRADVLAPRAVADVRQDQRVASDGITDARAEGGGRRRRRLSPDPKKFEAVTTWVTTSWDDGHQMDLRVAELLAKRGLRGTFYIPASAMQGAMTATQIRELSGEFEIGAHTLSHLILTETADPDAWREIAGSKRWIEDVTGAPCLMFCPPKGKYDARHLKMASEAGYLGVRTVELASLRLPRWRSGVLVLPTTIQAYPHGSAAVVRNAVKRGAVKNLWRYVLRGRSNDWAMAARSFLDEALQRGGAFHLWGHSWELDSDDQWRRLEDVLRLLDEHSAETLVVTNGQLCQRVAERATPVGAALPVGTATAREV
jgi:O-antigen/teichoic acid export membrane protein